MQKLFLILMLTILATGAIYSQVLIPNVIEGKVMLGPANVNHYNEGITAHHFSEIEKFKMRIIGWQQTVETNINNLEAKKKLKKKDEKQLLAYRLELAKIIYEKGLVNQLIGDWMRVKKRKKHCKHYHF